LGGYKPEPGFPDLTKNARRDGFLPDVAAYSGRIVNRQLQEGEHIYRLFGPEGVTHGVEVGESFAGGTWWGIGPSPKSAKEWREKAGVLDEFNRDGFIVEGTIQANGPKAAVGTIAEQAGKDLPGQYLPGGGTQARFFMDKASADRLSEIGRRVSASGKAESWADPISGIVFQIKPTGWTDANGVWGYLHMPSQGSVQTARLGAREQASKDNPEVIITP